MRIRLVRRYTVKPAMVPVVWRVRRREAGSPVVETTGKHYCAFYAVREAVGSAGGPLEWWAASELTNGRFVPAVPRRRFGHDV